MNRTDRLLAIILELQAKRWQRAEDLAATFEISKRTVYRDMQALAESGVPVVSVPGQGYSLVEGYFLPPLSFSPDEAILLLLGGDVMTQNFDAQYRAAAQSATRKIEAVLREQLRAEVQDLKAGLRFVRLNAKPATPELLQQIRRAILQRHRLSIDYETRYTDTDVTRTTREVDPYALIHIDRTWYLVAYCHLRKDIRYFRIDRIDALQILNMTFERPAELNLLSHESDERELFVRVLFSHHIKRWVREDPSFYVISMEDHPDGLLVTLTVRHERDVLQWLLGWGASMRVLEPQSLQQLVIEQAQAILQNHQIAESLLP